MAVVLIMKGFGGLLLRYGSNRNPLTHFGIVIGESIELERLVKFVDNPEGFCTLDIELSFH